MSVCVKELKSANEDLVKLVYDFNIILLELNKNNYSFSITDSINEANEYFTKNRIVFGLFVEQILIGFSVLKKEADIFWLDWIYITPEYRGFTYASILFDYSENYAKENGCDQLYIWIHPDNNLIAKFLTKKGYNTLNLIEIKKEKNKPNKVITILNNDYQY